LLIPAAAREGSYAPLASAEGRQDVICSSGHSSTSPQQARIEE
jgi:hypothetical protein